MKRIMVFSTCLVLLAGLALAEDADIAGSWKMTSKTPRGERTQTITIEQDGANIKVTTSNRRGDATTGVGTVEGSKISWKISRETPRGTFEINYVGTINGDTMTGTMQMGDRGSFEWSAKRTQKNEKSA